MSKFRFGKNSQKRLDTCHILLQFLMKEVLSLGVVDFTIICGHRTKESQDHAYRYGRSKLKWPQSKHNSLPSLAIDIAPWVNGEVSFSRNHSIFLAGIVMGVAKKERIPIRWGGNWDMDEEVITDQSFQDLLHFELMEDRNEDN